MAITYPRSPVPSHLRTPEIPVSQDPPWPMRNGVHFKRNKKAEFLSIIVQYSKKKTYLCVRI